MLTVSLALALLAPAPQGGANAPVVINEFAYDDSGTDDLEFVELFNCTSQTIDIGDWAVDSEDPNGPNPVSTTIPTGTMLAPGAYYVLGHAGVANVNQVNSGSYENDNESITLKDSTGKVIDTLVYEANKGLWNPALAEGEGVFGNFTSIDGTETSWSRVRDGLDSGNNGRDFVLAPSTPGASNNLATSAYADNFDALTVGANPADMIGSFVNATVVDPTVVDGFNPTAIAASPQGGNCIVLWDPSGGGDSAVVRRELAGPTILEAYVYVDAPVITGAAEFLHWNIGFGTVGTYSNAPDPSGTLGAGFDTNGSTGVSWLFQNTPAGAVLYLIDHNDGGWSNGTPITPETIIGSVAITSGSNDGWQRLYLERDGTNVTGVFGGTYGSGTTTGTVFSGPMTWTGPATCYVGYRENDGVTGIPAWVRPFTLDDISVSATPPSSSVSSFGVAVATTVGTPAIAAIGSPSVSATFGISLSGLVPSQFTTLFVGAPDPGIDLGAIGGQTGSNLYVGVPYVSFPVPVDGSGNASLSFWVCDPTFVGASLSWQVIDFDVNLPVAIPLGNSDRLDTTFGY